MYEAEQTDAGQNCSRERESEGNLNDVCCGKAATGNREDIWTLMVSVSDDVLATF